MFNQERQDVFCTHDIRSLYVTYISETFLERLVCEDEYDETFKNIIRMRIVLNAYLFCMLRTFKRCFLVCLRDGEKSKISQSMRCSFFFSFV